MNFPRLVALIYLEKFQVEQTGFANSPYVFDFDIALPRPTVVDRSRQLIVDEITGEETNWTDRGSEKTSGIGEQ